MKIILLKTVPKLGPAGEIKEVSEGYARNFLIPQGLADIASKHGMGVLEAQKNKKERLKKLNVKKKEKEAEKISNKKFTIKVKTDDKGTLYSKLGAELISQELKKQGYKISAKEVIVEKPIKKIGKYEIKLILHNKNIYIKLEVKKE